ncbi:PilT/PilU family type 4a pilus ATPase [Usitatibacter palustris]|uniref:Twitching mobility protein n=1 Tax=Usitatibacter palustris TaxID=2732487 RepID=A0A6M4H3M5_9PROT|nr:PilT/PilU family type 4a pilus ATPase [Usitatibacter palustris]QJR14126.1 Twitching mobility protein [Usitatibacter palustris]
MFIEKLLQLMAEKKASDIFISAGSPLSIKIAGQIMPVNPQSMDAETTKKICYEMLTPAQIEILERDKELNFAKPMLGLGNFRVNMFWQKGSVGGVIRFVTAEIPAIASLNLPPVLSSLVMEKRGLILVVGATGSGKSTTLASMLDFRNKSAAGHILTIEDPIEYVFTPQKSIINQREVGNDTTAFHEALRNAMRQAPDCILIGEIRDQETMRMALTYALSGHLCLSTLHANNAYQAMNRVISFFPLEVRPMLLQDLAVSLKAVISQRLIKTIDGGRTPAMEVLLNTRNVQEQIEKGEVGEIKEAMEKSMSPGSQTFEQDLFRLVRQNKISTEEALANADSATNLGLLLGNSGIMPAMAEKAKQPSRPGSTSFGDFKISEEPEQTLGH